MPNGPKKSKCCETSRLASYARIQLHEYLSRDDIGSKAADSIILKNPLSNVGNNIGEMKLEYKIREGFFISPKLYYNLTTDNEEIIKSAALLPMNQEIKS